MDVMLGVGIQMMMAMHSRPPDHTSLSRRLAQKRDDELKGPTRLVRSVTEIAVEARRDRPHADDVEH